MGRFISIKYRIVSVFIACITIGVILLAIFTNTTLGYISNTFAERQLLETTNYYSQLIKNKIDHSLSVLITARSTLLHSMKYGNTDRYEYESYLKDVLSNYPQLDSIYIMMEPNVFDGRDSEFTMSTVGSNDSGKVYIYVYTKDDGTTISTTDEDDIGVNIDGDYDLDMYQRPKKDRKNYVSNPYLYNFTDYSAMIISVSVPIIDENDKFLGVLAVDMNGIELFDQLSNPIFNTGYLTVTSDDNKYIYTANEDDLGDDVAPEFENVFINDPNTTEKLDKNVDVKGVQSMVMRIPLRFDYSDQVYSVAVVAPNSEIFKDSNAAVLGITLSVILIGAVMAVVTVIYLGKKMRPLVQMAKVSDEIARGNINVNLPATKNDEIGTLSKSFGLVIETFDSLLTDIGNLSKEHANGNIIAKIDASKYQGSFNEVALATSQTVGDYAKMLQEIIHCVSNFAKGNFNVEIRNYPGRKVGITKALKQLNNNLSSVRLELGDLIENASQGELDFRLDENKYKGDWRILVDSLNKLMNHIAEPINETALVLKEVSQGKFSVKMTGDYQGQYLVVKNSINNTVDTIAGYIREISRILNEMSNNNLRQSVTGEYVGEFSLIKDSLNSIIKNFNTILNNLGTTANQLSDGSSVIAQSTGQISSGSREQAESVLTLKGLIDEVISSTTNDLENTGKAKLIIEESHQSIDRGTAEMNKLLSSMSELTNVSQNINSIVKVIDNIAFQTNILAVNAAIEASHAGLYGRGFEVVANEVKDLAQKSIESSKEIEKLIKQAVDKIKTGTENANATNAIMQQIINVINSTNGLMDTIAQSATSQVESSDAISKQIQMLLQIADTNNYTTEQLVASTEELASQAEELNQTANDFELNDR